MVHIGYLCNGSKITSGRSAIKQSFAAITVWKFLSVYSKDVNESRNAPVSKENSRAREFNFSTSEKFRYAQGEIVLSRLTG